MIACCLLLFIEVPKLMDGNENVHIRLNSSFEFLFVVNFEFGDTA